MNSKNSSPGGELDPAARAPADRQPATSAWTGEKAGPGSPGETPAKPARVLVVLDDGFDLQAIDETLRREHHQVMVDSDRAAAMGRVESEQVDLVLLCSNQTGRHAMEMLTRITAAKPALPVIVVTSPEPPPGSRGDGPPPAVEPSGTAEVDAALLLRSVREALSEPRVKRLIRLTGSHGEPRFMARNARWLSEDLQARYSSPFHWTLPGAASPLPPARVAAATSPTI